MQETPDFFAKTEAHAAAAAGRLVERLLAKRLTLALAESCTAGLVSDLIARIGGASGVLWGSFICYSPEAKERMLGIDGGFLKQYGLVSGETAREMALHALETAGVSIAAAVTGLAGPDGDGSDTPVGTVWVAVVRRGEEDRCQVRELHFRGTRAEVRMAAAAAVIEKLLDSILTKEE